MLIFTDGIFFFLNGNSSGCLRLYNYLSYNWGIKVWIVVLVNGGIVKRMLHSLWHRIQFTIYKVWMTG